MLSVDGVVVDPTVFPDGTSQVWKLPKEITEKRNVVVEFLFENEAEVFQLIQLLDLFNEFGMNVELYCPFLPYSRQDKTISNERTFALSSFLNILRGKIHRLKTIDAHNPEFVRNGWGRQFGFVNVSPANRIARVIGEYKPDSICYPDKSASHRYDLTGALPEGKVVLKKVRDQSTGEITGLDFETNIAPVSFSRALLVDDICDGGRTFIEAAHLLLGVGYERIGLYVSHGIFSKGLDPLKEAGIDAVFTYAGRIY